MHLTHFNTNILTLYLLYCIPNMHFLFNLWLQFQNLTMLSQTDAIMFVREHFHLVLTQKTEPDTIMLEEDFKKAVDVVLKKCGIAQVSSINNFFSNIFF